MEGEKIDGGSYVPLLVSINNQNHKYDMFCDEKGKADHVASGASFYKTCFNALNALSGVGIISVPYALASGGWLSLILMFVIASITFYTGLLMKRCMDMDSSLRTYPDIGERAFGRTGRIFVSISMYLELYLVVTGFLIFVGDNLHKLLPDVNFDINGINIGGSQSFVIIVGLIILPTVWLGRMSILSYISASGVMASLVLIVSVLWAATIDGIGFHNKGNLLNWKGIPTAINLYVFCYAGHPIFPTLYTSMSNKKQFYEVLQVCFFFCSFTYGSMGILGYLMFGSDLTSQITLNLPTDKMSSKVAIITTMVNPIAKYALEVTPIVDALETQFLSQRYRRQLSFVIRTTLVASFVIRTTLVASTIIVALYLPYYGDLMSLVGASLNIMVSVTLPCLCFLRISGVYHRCGLELFSIWVIVLMGVFIMMVGTYIALLEIMENFK